MALSEASFRKDIFLEDLENLCVALNRPYSETMTCKVIDTFQESFQRGCVVWRATDREDGELNYRVYERQSVDMVALACDAGFISKENILGHLIQSWDILYGQESQQLCDFDPHYGLSKFWVFFGGIRPLVEILSVPEIPHSIRQKYQTFKALSLTGVRHTAVDIKKQSINLYFRTPRGITREDIDSYIALAQASPISDNLYEELRQFFPQAGGAFAVTMDFATGKVTRVAFYALRLLPTSAPKYNSRIQLFFDTSPSYDTEDMKAVAWSFGAGNETYMKAEHSYSGEVVSLFRDWKSGMTDTS